MNLIALPTSPRLEARIAGLLYELSPSKPAFCALAQAGR